MNASLFLVQLILILVCFTSIKAFSLRGNLPSEEEEGQEGFIVPYQVKRTPIPPKRRLDKFRFIYGGLGKRASFESVNPNRYFGGSVFKNNPSAPNDVPLLRPFGSNLVVDEQPYSQPLMEKVVHKLRSLVADEIGRAAGDSDAYRLARMKPALRYPDLPEVDADQYGYPTQQDINSKDSLRMLQMNLDGRAGTSNIIPDSDRSEDVETKMAASAETEPPEESVSVTKKWWAQNHFNHLRTTKSVRPLRRLDPAFYFLGLGK